MLNEPLGEVEAKRLIRTILDTGRVAWTEHVTKQRDARNLTTVDCVNVMRAGSVEPPDYELGTWRVSRFHRENHGGRGLSISHGASGSYSLAAEVSR